MADFIRHLFLVWGSISWYDCCLRGRQSLLIIRLSFVPSFCDRSHSGTKEGEQAAASLRSSGRLVRARPLSMWRRRPSSCVTAVASAVAATFSKNTVAIPHLPSSLPPLSIGDDRAIIFYRFSIAAVVVLMSSLAVFGRPSLPPSLLSPQLHSLDRLIWKECGHRHCHRHRSVCLSLSRERPIPQFVQGRARAAAVASDSVGPYQDTSVTCFTCGKIKKMGGG